MKKAFTLIELLVVIAIIAILAAILFPVFAQAKLAAKKTQALSNTKQLGLSILMYNNDYDDVFPVAFGSTNWTGNDLWPQRVYPYVKNIGVFGSPADNLAGKPASVGDWAGTGISFAANAYYGDWCCAPNWTSGFQQRGPMGIPNNTTWLDFVAYSTTSMTQPAGTILLGEKHGDDIAKWNTAYEGNDFNDQGNFSAFGMGAVLGGQNVDGIGWGPELIPNGTKAAAPFEYGPNGAVSASYNNQAVFVYVDGHANSKVPASTNPNPTTQPQNNLWDGLR
ncbi:MAG TPA: prepilin-type N-terminal cleavage/methylation domain-containing protein [Fimbriimonas sp.]|nr:prepilin-type N-terminal cleavage/methylation domain-containing protein [Fimbriimonas sp.]